MLFSEDCNPMRNSVALIVPLIVQKSKPSRGQAEKLKELELSGLVDFDKSHARYSKQISLAHS